MATDETRTDDAAVDAFLAQLDTVAEPDAALEVRSLDRREIAMRIVPWEVPAISRDGPEVIMRGAFDGVDASRVVLQLEHENPPAGKGIEYENRSDGAWMTFKVSRTQRGDDILTLAADGVAAGASVSYQDIPGGVETYRRSGRTLRVVHKAVLRAVSTTWNPTWADAAVQSIRSAPEGVPDMPETPDTQPETPAQTIDIGPLTAAITSMDTAAQARDAALTDRLVRLEERSRADIVIPSAPQPPSARERRGDWMQVALRMLSGERVNDLQLRTLDDLITTDNVGVIPPAFSTEIIGVIDPSRPFLQTTRRLDTPAAGMSLQMPKIVTRPTTGVQTRYSSENPDYGDPEKSDIASTATSITSATFDAITIAGGGDISLQLLKRSSPSYLSLYLELLAEAYGQNAEAEALAALLTGFGDPGGVNDGGALDPETTTLGSAWGSAYSAMRRGPDTIWMSSAAVGAFIDARAGDSNLPLYGNLRADFSVAGGVGGNISGMRPVHVPALNGTEVDVLIGNSRGFAWTEDGTYTLQVDVPAKAGRDVAVVGILWFAPLYPTAFTGYALAGS